MRCAPGVLAVLLAVGLSGCTAAPAATPTPSATPTPVTLSGDAAFDAPIICRADADYTSVQTALSSRDLLQVHSAAAAAATDEAAGFAQERAHTWAAAVRPLLKAYFAVGDEQVQWYRDVAKAPSIDAAAALTFPDGTTVTEPVWIAMRFPATYRCP